jgi:tRNA A-37 threonylcarbamoyl transferase component Bud32
MFNIPGYHILCQIHDSTQSIVYRGIRQADQQAVILKRLNTHYPTPEEIRKYKQEYQLTRRLNLAGVVKAYRLEQYQNNLVIIFEDFGGDSLQLLLNHHSLTLAEFLDIAIQITDSLNQIHAANIIHKDINPSNIVYNPQTGQIKVIDFGIASVLSRENPTLQNPNVIEGTLAYISPEQTGRMNRYVDYRTDFYSLGVTFYKLLTGNLPFEAQDAMELVHCHLAKYPTPPHLLDGNVQMQEGKGVGEIPQAVSDIVLKLLAKTADERYKSALGIQADLVICLMQLEANGFIEPFPLGENDVSEKFQVPQKIYGRDAELAILFAAFNRVAKGSKELMLVSGFAGIGKSVLVQELYQPIVQERGYFIVGKFDQFKQNRPFASLVQAFSDLIGQILTESEAKIADWRSQLLQAFGINGQVIIDVIPKLELIIGQQPPVPELPATEAQNRFNRLFAQFIQVFAQAEHPLVIFLDDLQWADSASLDLLERLLTDIDSHYLLIIAAYRDNEINPLHPLNRLLDKSPNLGVAVNQINLSPLALIHLNQLIADALDCSLEEVNSLAELVWNKTQGNPFFASQFLTSIYTKGLLQFDFDSGSWQWDIQEIAAQTVSDNVVGFIAQKLQTLSKNTQSALQLAAGIGNVFDLTTLAAIYDKSRLETAIDLWEAVQAGLIIPLGEDYKFIQAAVLTTSSYFTDNDPNDNSSSLTGLAMVKALAIHPRDETERFVKTPGFIPQ